MDWAQGIEVVGGELVARVADAAGAQELVKLADLGTRGLPTAIDSPRPLERVDLSELHPIDCAEYLEVFGLQGTAGEQGGHAIYELQTKKCRWVIPALALIRGLFRPNNVLLDDVFRPQVLERVSYFDPVNGRVIVTAPWAKMVGIRASDPSALLAWLWRDAAAKRMAGSVHRSAMSGAIGVDATGVKVNLSVGGKRLGRTFYATRCTVTKAYLPSHSGDADGNEEVIDFFGPVPQRCGWESNLNNALNVVLERRGGGLEVTDAEWEALLPILRADTRGKQPRVDIRQVLNLLLQELVQGRRTPKAEVPPEVNRSLTHYGGKWRQQRTLQKALEVLNGIRGAG